MFIRIELFGTIHEWGYHSEFVPCVGDTCCLCFEEPDAELTGNEVVTGTIVQRQFVIGGDDESQEVWLTAVGDGFQLIPEGYVAHSPEWPSTEYGARRRQLKRDCEAIKSGGTGE